MIALPRRTALVRDHGSKGGLSAVSVVHLPWEPQITPPDMRLETRPRVLSIRAGNAPVLKSIDEIEEADSVGPTDGELLEAEDEA